MPEAYYRFRAEIVRRGGDRGMRSALVAAAYRSGQQLHFDREEQVIDYSRRSGVLTTGILAPESVPLWMRNREDLWNAIETKEKRCDARLARDFTLALPHMLSREQMQEVVTGFLEKQFVSRGLICDFAIHEPDREGDSRNYHAHVLVTERPANEYGFVAKKDRGLNERGMITHWRQAWQDELNRLFERDQVRDSQGELYFVDQRSYKERGIDKEATRHMGPAATALERQGIETEVGDFNRRVAQRNAQREQLRDELEQIGEEIAYEQRRIEKYQRLVDEREPMLEREDVREKYGRVGARIDDAQPRPKPRRRDFGL